MSDLDAHASAFWDERYDRDEFVYGEEPNAHLAAQRHRLHPGMNALLPGDGEGRNGVWLAEHGLDVIAVDQSAAGLRKAERLAAQRSVSLETVQADLTRWDWPVSQFDIVVSIWMHFPPTVREQMHHAMLRALRPGGLLVIEAYRPEQVRYREQYGTVGGPPQKELLYSPEMLRNDFANAITLELEATDVDLAEGKHHRGRSAVVRGIFQRPAVASE